MRLELRDDRQGGLEPGQHRLRQDGQVVGGPGLGGERVREHVVHLRGRQAQPLGLAREVPADLVGVQVRLGEQVADAGQREVPAVARGAQELLEHRQLHRLVGAHGRAVELQPAVERGDVVAALLGERLVDLDVGVAARGDLAEHLHQAVVAERQRGVALLAGEQRGVLLEVEVVAGQPVEGERADGERLLGRPVERLQPERRGLAVVRGVVGDHLAEVGVGPGADVRVLDALLRLGVVGDRHLVDLGGLVGVGDRDQLDPDRGPVLGAAEHGDPLDAGHGEVAPLAAEPAGGLEVGVQGVAHRVAHARLPSGVAGCGAGSRNQ